MIDEFLGDLRHSPLIKRLNEGDRDRLDSPLTLDELDRAFKNPNLRTAGSDDFSLPLLSLGYSMQSPVDKPV